MYKCITEYNISEETASYAITALDPTAQLYKAFMKEFTFINFTLHQQFLKEQDMQLKLKMQEFNFTDIKQLFEAVAVK